MNQSKLSRREFVGAMAGLGLAAAMPAAVAAQSKNKSQMDEGRPLIVSTWRQGKPANEKAAEVLAVGGTRLDAVEKGINTAELNPHIMSVGYGSLPNAEGVLQLDAAIMDGPAHRAGAVGGLEKIPTPISVARRVMEKTTHTLLGGEAALRFAVAEGFEPQQLLTPKALERWERWRDDPQRRRFWRARGEDRPVTWPVGEEAADTITMVLLDENGDLAAGGSSSGLAWKIPGRIGDVPIIGAGIFVDNTVGGAGATGNGDEMMKYCTSIIIVERMRQGLDPQAACESVLQWMVATNPGNKDISANVYAVSKAGKFGAASIRPGDFTYAVWMPGVSELRTAKAIL